MESPKCRRFYRHHDDFSICVNIGEKGYVLAEHPNERFTTFFYVVYGSGKCGKIFESDSTKIESKKLTDVRKYIDSEVVFQADKDLHIIGFNTLDKNVKWEAELLTSENKIISTTKEKSFLLCLDDEVTVNDKKFKRYAYAEIFPGIEYNLNIGENGALGLFSMKL